MQNPSPFRCFGVCSAAGFYCILSLLGNRTELGQLGGFGSAGGSGTSGAVAELRGRCRCRHLKALTVGPVV